MSSDLAIRGFSAADPSRWPITELTLSQQTNADLAAKQVLNQAQLNRYQDSLQKHAGVVDTALDTRPKLAAPDQTSEDETSAHSIAAMNALLDRIKSSDNDNGIPLDLDPTKSDAFFWRLTMDGWVRRKGSQEFGANLSRERMMKNQEVQNALQKELHKLQDELAEYNKKSKAFSWIDSLVTGATILGLMGAVAATVFTGGAALPTVLQLASAAATFAKAGNEAVKGHYDKKTAVHTGEIFVNTKQRDKCDGEIKKRLQEMKDLVEYMSKHWKSLKEMQANKANAVSFR